MQKVVPKDCRHLKQIIHECIERLGPNCDLNFIDVSNMVDLTNVFSHPNHRFNGDISRWDVSHVEDMMGLFAGSEFNGDISKWDVSKATSMGLMFERSEFNGDISGWKIAKGAVLDFMFAYSMFRGDISAWNLTYEQSAFRMFEGSVLDLEDKIPDWFKARDETEPVVSALAGNHP